MAKETKLVVCCGGCDPKCGKCGEQQWIEMTDEEIAQREIDRIAGEKARAEREAAEQARLAAKASAEEKLAKLGLTAEEIKAIL